MLDVLLFMPIITAAVFFAVSLIRFCMARSGYGDMDVSRALFIASVIVLAVTMLPIIVFFVSFLM